MKTFTNRKCVNSIFLKAWRTNTCDIAPTYFSSHYITFVGAKIKIFIHVYTYTCYMD